MSAKVRRVLGARIVRLRERKGWSQEELADEAGIHQTYLSGVENGHRNLTVDSLVKIAVALERTVGELFK